MLPLIVTALFVARRLSPATRIRVGSLSIDQFASVVASFTLAFFFLAAAGAFVPSMLIALLGAAGLFAATVLARWIPFFAGDFLGREETPAHVVAREAVAPVQKPRAPKTPKQPKPAKDSAAASGTAAGWAKRPATGGAGRRAGIRLTRCPGSRSSCGRGACRSSGRSGYKCARDPGLRRRAGSRRGRPCPVGITCGCFAGASPAAASAATSTPARSNEPASPAAEQKPATAAAASAAAAPTAGEQTRAADVPAASAAAAAPTAGEQTRAADVPAASGGSAPTTVNPQVRPQEQVRAQEPIGATVDPASRHSEDEAHPAHEAFWFAVAQPRTAVDERTGAPAFVIEPGGWVLALEDRGTSFLVQHTDGRLGVLRDLSNIERG